MTVFQEYYLYLFAYFPIFKYWLFHTSVCNKAKRWIFRPLYSSKTKTFKQQQKYMVKYSTHYDIYPSMSCHVGRLVGLLITFKRWCVLLIWIIVGQGTTVLAVGVGGCCLDSLFLSFIYLFFLPLSRRHLNVDRTIIWKRR